MEKNNIEEYIKIDTNNIYIDKKTISSFISKANNFFDSFENYVKSQSKKDEIVNKKLDYIISLYHEKIMTQIIDLHFSYAQKKNNQKIGKADTIQKNQKM